MDNSEFVIGKLLGEGDFSKVYLCKKKNSNLKYAMKILKRGDFDLASYECETEKLSKVNHDNIIKWIKSEKNGENLCIITEYFPGKTLEYVIDALQRPLSRNEILSIFIPLMSALSYLHSLKIMHGDVDVMNIMIKFGKSKNVEAVKLIDFGKSDKSFLLPISLLAYAKKTCLIDIVLSGIILLKMLYGTCSQDFVVDIYCRCKYQPDMQDWILNNINPFFRKLIDGMLLEDNRKGKLTSCQVLAWLLQTNTD